MFAKAALACPLVRAAVTALAATAATTPLPAQVSYSRTEQLLTWNTSLLVSGDEVAPQWLLHGNRFWYRNKTSNGVVS
jgi:hypothetical protein